MSCVHCVLVTCLPLKSDFPWTPEEKHRHKVNGHAENDNRCEILREVDWIFQTPTSSVLLSLARSITRVSLSKNLTGYVYCVDWQRTPLRMLLSELFHAKVSV